MGQLTAGVSGSGKVGLGGMGRLRQCALGDYQVFEGREAGDESSSSRGGGGGGGGGGGLGAF